MCGLTVIHTFSLGQLSPQNHQTHSFIFVLAPVLGEPLPSPPESLEYSTLFSPEDVVNAAPSAQWHSSLSPQSPSAHKPGGETLTLSDRCNAADWSHANSSYVPLQLVLLQPEAGLKKRVERGLDALIWLHMFNWVYTDLIMIARMN